MGGHLNKKQKHIVHAWAENNSSAHTHTNAEQHTRHLPNTQSRCVYRSGCEMRWETATFLILMSQQGQQVDRGGWRLGVSCECVCGPVPGFVWYIQWHLSPPSFKLALFFVVTVWDAFWRYVPVLSQMDPVVDFLAGLFLHAWSTMQWVITVRFKWDFYKMGSV